MNERLMNIDKLPPEQANAVKLESETTLKKLKTKRINMKREIAAAKVNINKQINHPGRAAKAKKILFDKTRPKSVPMNSKCERFFDPIASTSSFIDAPGPGVYDVAHFGTAFGNATVGVAERDQGFTWGNAYRPTDTDAPWTRSVATLKLNQFGYAYFSDLNANSGDNYQPNMMVETSRGRRKKIGEVRVRKNVLT